MAERAHPEDPGFQDKWFGLKKNEYKRKLYDQYKYCKQFVKDKDVLDVSCGVGWESSLLTNPKSIIGIDISNEVISDAKRLLLYGKRLKVVTYSGGEFLLNFRGVDYSTGKKFLECFIRYRIKNNIYLIHITN